MPGFNGTGPQGQGPRTGGGFGNCRPGANEPAPQQDGVYGVGRGGVPRGGGRGRAFGGGRGRGRRFAGWGRTAAPAPAPLTREEEVAQLQQQAADIQARIQELTAED